MKHPYGYGAPGAELPSRESLLVAPPAGYVDIGVSKMLRSITRTLAALMVGPKGVGKSMATQALAHEMGLPVVRVDCHEDMGASHLLGAVRIQGGSTWIDVGLLPQAIEAANTYGEAILVLEEVNALSPAAQIILHSLLDDRKGVFVPSLQKSYTLLPGSILRVVGSCNPPSYGGTHSLNEALRSRFAVLQVSYMQKAQEMLVLAPLRDRMPSDLRTKLDLNRLMQLTASSRTGDWTYAFSTRDLVQTLQVATVLHSDLGTDGAVRQALGMLGAKMEDEETTKKFAAEVQSAYGIDLSHFDPAAAFRAA